MYISYRFDRNTAIAGRFIGGTPCAIPAEAVKAIEDRVLLLAKKEAMIQKENPIRTSIFEK